MTEVKKNKNKYNTIKLFLKNKNSLKVHNLKIPHTEFFGLHSTDDITRMIKSNKNTKFN